jgi:exonuclease III
LAAGPTILIGDFNTGKRYIDEDGATFIGSEYMDQLGVLGYLDSWRTLNPESREYTWFSSAQNGFRLDYAFLSHALVPQLSYAKHVDAPRLNGVTDHSALLVDLQNQ